MFGGDTDHSAKAGRSAEGLKDGVEGHVAGTVRFVLRTSQDDTYSKNGYLQCMSEPFERLRQARLKAGFSDTTAATTAFGWNVNTYRSHENGIRGLRPAAAARYAKAFKVSAAWLLTGEGSLQGSDASSTLNGEDDAITISRHDLKEIVAFVLIARRTSPEAAAVLADTVVECLSAPPLDALDSDVVRSFQVRFELRSEQSFFPRPQ